MNAVILLEEEGFLRDVDTIKCIKELYKRRKNARARV